MEIEQSFTVPYSRHVVWARFHDTPGIVACLPGASLTAPVANGMLKLAMTVKLGPIVASFAGDGAMQLDDAQYRGSITGTGVDRKSSSRVKGVASFALEATAASETRVDVKVDYTIGGSLAQFSRGGIVKELATRMTEAVQLPPRDFYEMASQHPVLWEQLRTEAERREMANHAILAGEARKSDTFYLV